MEDLQVLDFKVKSSIHDYKVKFINDTELVLRSLLLEGDVLIIDRKVHDLNNSTFTKENLKNTKIILSSNETQKSYDGIKPIIQELIKIGFRKNHRIIGIGGGVIQDITAFISSIMYRGVQWFFFPTTLLAQGDSCIGSKTSINFGEFKNQIGGFYPPNEIFLDVSFLDTLSKADIQSGLGEMCHYFIIKGEDEFNNYKENYFKSNFDKSNLSAIISKSLKIKKELIEIDEFDQNKRRVFNYGHSFGHAIESLTNYSIPHGIAVSFGMDIANYISVKKDYLST